MSESMSVVLKKLIRVIVSFVAGVGCGDSMMRVKDLLSSQA